MLQDGAAASFGQTCLVLHRQNLQRGRHLLRYHPDRSEHRELHLRPQLHDVDNRTGDQNQDCVLFAHLPQVFKLEPSALSDIGIGKIVTLISKDVTSFESAIIFLNDIWISVILLTITSVLMYSRVGVSALAGVLFLVLVIPLEGKYCQKF
jgi:hypothetical protein